MKSFEGRLILTSGIDNVASGCLGCVITWKKAMDPVWPMPESNVQRGFANTKGNTECVEFIKQTLDAPATAKWRQGRRIIRLPLHAPDPVARGTAIATFVNGRYPQSGNSGMHAAIYMGQDAQGIHVLDPWRAQGRVLPRTIPWQPRRPGLSNNGTAFSVMEW